MKKVIGWISLLCGILSLIGGITTSNPNPNTGVVIGGIILKIAMIISGILLLSGEEKGCWITMIIAFLLVFIVCFVTMRI